MKHLTEKKNQCDEYGNMSYEDLQFLLQSEKNKKKLRRIRAAIRDRENKKTSEPQISRPTTTVVAKTSADINVVIPDFPEELLAQYTLGLPSRGAVIWLKEEEILETLKRWNNEHNTHLTPINLKKALNNLGHAVNGLEEPTTTHKAASRIIGTDIVADIYPLIIHNFENNFENEQQILAMLKSLHSKKSGVLTDEQAQWELLKKTLSANAGFDSLNIHLNYRDTEIDTIESFIKQIPLHNDDTQKLLQTCAELLNDIPKDKQKKYLKGFLEKLTKFIKFFKDEIITKSAEEINQTVDFIRQTIPQIKDFLNNSENDFYKLEPEIKQVLIAREIIMEYIFRFIANFPKEKNLKNLIKFFQHKPDWQIVYSFDGLFSFYFHRDGIFTFEPYNNGIGLNDQQLTDACPPNIQSNIWHAKIREKAIIMIAMVDDWESFLTDTEARQLEAFRTNIIAHMERTEQEQIAFQRTQKEEINHLRETNPEMAKKFIWGVIRFTLERNKGSIQKTIIQLKQHKKLNHLLQKHNITGLEMTEDKLSGRNQYDLEWQQIATVVAELTATTESFKPPHYLKGNTPLSKFALQLIAWDKATLRSHLPDGVYDKIVEASLTHYQRQITNLEQEEYKYSSWFYDEDDFPRKSDDELQQEIQRATDNRRRFYQETSATPSWWLTPDWKRISVLRDNIWNLIRKNRLRKESVLPAFDELIGQCNQELSRIQVLINSYTSTTLPPEIFEKLPNNSRINPNEQRMERRKVSVNNQILEIRKLRRAYEINLVWTREQKDEYMAAKEKYALGICKLLNAPE